MSSEIDSLLNETFGPQNPQSAQVDINPVPEADPVGKEVDEVFGTPEKRFKESSYLAEQTDPGVATEAYELSKKHNVPAHFIQNNIESFRATKKQPALEYNKVKDQSPALAKWLENPTFASMSKDDIDVLKNIEHKVSGLKQQKDEGFVSEFASAANTGVQNLSVSSYHLRAAYGMGNIEDFADEIARVNLDIQNKQRDLPEFAKEFAEVSEKNINEINAEFSKFQASFKEIRDGKILDGLIDAGASGGKTVGESIEFIYEAVKRPKGLGRVISESLAFSFPGLALGFGGAKAGAAAGAAVGSVVPGAGTAAGGVVGGLVGFAGGTFVGSSATEVGAWINSALTERGYDLTNRDDIIKAYSNKELISEIRNQAERKGITTAGVDALFSAFGGKFLKAAAGKGLASKAVAGAKDIGVQSVGETVGEASGQLAAHKGDLGKVNIGESILEGISSFGQSIGDTAIGAGIKATKGKEIETPSVEMRGEFADNPVDAATEIAERGIRAKQSLEELSLLDEIGQLAEESQLQTRSPEAFADLIDSVTEGDAPQQVFFQKDDWNKYWTDKGESPVQKAEELLSVESYNDSDTNGTPVAVDLKEFASKLGGTDNYNELLQIVTTQPDGLKLDEAKEYSQALPELMNQVIAESRDEKQRLEQQEIELKEVKTQLETQLVEAGRKKIEAVPVIEFYKTIGQRSGLGAAQIAKEFPLTINQGFKDLGREDEIETLFQSQVWKEEGVQISDPVISEEFDGTYIVNALDKNGNVIGEARLFEEDGVLRPDDTNFSVAIAVNEAHRRKGIGSELYKKAESALGMPIMHRQNQTDLGAALSRDRKKLGLGLNFEDIKVEFENFEESKVFGKYKNEAEFLEKAQKKTIAKYYTLKSEVDFSEMIQNGHSFETISDNIQDMIAKERPELKIITKKAKSNKLSKDYLERNLQYEYRKEGNKYYLYDKDNNKVPYKIGNTEYDGTFNTRERDEQSLERVKARIEKEKPGVDEAAAKKEFNKRKKIYDLKFSNYMVKILEFNSDRSEFIKNKSKKKKGDNKLKLSDKKINIISKKKEELSDIGLIIGDADRLKEEFESKENFSEADDYAERISTYLLVNEIEKGSNDVEINKFIDSIDFGDVVLNNEIKTNARVDIRNGIRFFIDKIDRISFNQDKRGQIGIKGKEFDISLFEKADASTFFHESGHYFLEVLKDLASRENSGEEIKNDFNSILEWLGVDSADNIKTEHHEMWARGFEAYLREGKAPSDALRKAYNTFKTWLVNIYKNIKDLDIVLNDEIRSVFDRMLASKEEIDSAISKSTQPLFRNPIESGMPDALVERYNNAIDKARLHAEEEMSKRLMSDETREKRKRWQVLRKKIKAEKTKEVNALQVYNNMSLLTKGKYANGDALPAGTVEVKISFHEAAAKYPEIVSHKNFKGAFSVEKGTNIDIVAGILGYKNADELVQDFLSVPPKSKAISLLTEQQLKQTSEDSLDDPAIAEQAELLLHNEEKAQRLKLESEFLATNNKSLTKQIIRQVVKRPAPNKQIKELAKKHIGQSKISNIKPNVYRLAERRYAKEAGVHLSNGDLQAAFDAKEKERLNFELYKLAVEAKQFVEKKTKDTKKFFKKDEDLAKTRDIHLISAARAILARYGLGRSSKEPLQFLAKIKEYNPEAYEHLSGIITEIINEPDNYKNIELDKFKDLMDATQALWDMSKDIKSVEVKGVKYNIEAAVDDIATASEKFRKPGRSKDKYQRTASKWDEFKSGLLGVKAYLRRFEHWIDVMDLGDIDGPFRKFLYEATSDATSEFLETNKKFKKRYVDLSKDVRDRIDLNKEIKSDELGFAFKNKSEILGALLHTGNESNLKKLLVGREWGSLNEDGTLNTSKWDQFIARMWEDGTLTKEDYDYVQSLWDLMEEIKPRAQKAHKKIFGFYFDEITSQTIETPFGTYRGGYAPAKVDPNAVKDITRKAELEEFIKGHSSFTYPASGGRGFTKGRVENFAKPLNINLSLVGKHLEDVLRFAIVKPAVVDAAKVVMNEKFKENINSIDDQVIDKMIKPALSRADKNTISNTDPSTPSLAKKFGGTIKNAASLQLMFANVVNTAEQIGGFGIASTRISPRFLAKAGFRYLSNHKAVAQQVAEASPAMRVRFDDQMFEIEKTAQDIFSEKSSLTKMRDWAGKHAYFMQVFTQNFVDNITWSASYDESVSKGLTHQQAVTKGDADVRMTQSSRRPIDISSLETNATLGFFQMFMNFFNMMANVNVSNFTKLYHEDIGMTKKYGKGLYMYSMGFASVAIISQALRKAAAGGIDEDEDGEYIDDLFDVFIGSQVDLGLAMLPIVGPGINAGINQANDKFYDDRVSASPAVSAISTTVGVVSKLASGKLTDGKNTKGDVRDSLTALGIITGLPMRPISKPLGYLIDVDEGKAKPSGPIDAVRGIITGRPGVK